MSVLRTKDFKTAVCGQEANRRILKYDHSGRIFQLGLRFKVLRFKRPLGVRQLSVMSELKVGESGVLVALDLPDSVQNHLMHMGFVPGALVTALRRAPAGDPTVYSVDGTEIALRHETAGAIRVREPGTEGAADSPAALESPDLEALELIEAVR